MALDNRDLNDEKERRSATKICLLEEYAERMPVLQLILGTAAMLILGIQRSLLYGNGRDIEDSR